MSKKHETWLTPYWDAYCVRFPGAMPNGGHMGKCIKPFHDRDGQTDALGEWQAYLALTDAMYVSPTRFAVGYGAWRTAFSGATFSEPFVKDGWLTDEAERATRPRG